MSMKLIRIHVQDRDESDDSYYAVHTSDSRWELQDKIAELEDDYREELREHQTEAADEALDWQEYDPEAMEDYVVDGLRRQGYELYFVDVIDRYWDRGV